MNILARQICRAYLFAHGATLTQAGVVSRDTHAMVDFIEEIDEQMGHLRPGFWQSFEHAYTRGEGLKGMFKSFVMCIPLVSLLSLGFVLLYTDKNKSNSIQFTKGDGILDLKMDFNSWHARAIDHFIYISFVMPTFFMTRIMSLALTVGVAAVAVMGSFGKRDSIIRNNSELRERLVSDTPRVEELSSVVLPATDASYTPARDTGPSVVAADERHDPESPIHSPRACRRRAA